MRGQANLVRSQCRPRWLERRRIQTGGEIKNANLTALLNDKEPSIIARRRGNKDRQGQTAGEARCAQAGYCLPMYRLSKRKDSKKKKAHPIQLARPFAQGFFTSPL